MKGFGFPISLILLSFILILFSRYSNEKIFNDIKESDLLKECGVFKGYSEDNVRLGKRKFFNLNSEKGERVKFRYIEQIHGKDRDIQRLNIGDNVCFLYSNNTTLDYPLVKKIFLINNEGK